MALRKGSKRGSKRGSKKVARKCPKGTIRRASYTRTLSRTGRKSYVKAACVPDKGAPGKTPKNKRILPKPGNEIRLHEFGYKLSKPQRSRRRSLARASSRHGSLKVLRRVGLLRNLTGEKANKAKFSSDVNWMSQYHSKHKGSKKSKK